MAAPPNRNEISDTYPNPTDAVARAGFGKLWDYVTGLLGATGNAVEARAALGVDDPMANGFRLTLTSNVPVTPTDVVGGTIYACPMTGNVISLYDATLAKWVKRTSAQFSLALGTLTSNLPHDVFCYSNAGVPTLEFTPWTNLVTRATALVRLDGVLVKSGAPTRRYLGTFRTNGTTTTVDSDAFRYLWNYYNRVDRRILVLGLSSTWTYATNAWRQAQGATQNQFNCVIGVAEDITMAMVRTSALGSSGTYANCMVAMGLDSTTAPTSNTVLAATANVAYVAYNADYPVLIPEGGHYIAWLEIATSGISVTFQGGGGGAILGTMRA